MRICLTTLVLLVMAACAVNPATGRREISLVSEAREIEMGREADPEIQASLGIVEDPELRVYVADLGARLAATSERPSLPWSFKVVDDPMVNAFALPGGFIYLTRGILARFDSEAELAGVLGHEIGHVTARHSVSQMSRQQLQQIGLGVGMILSENVRRARDALGAGLQLLSLRYSRGDETESDELGLRYMARAGYDGSALLGVFRMLADVSGNSEGRVPEWQLTHPHPENREEHIGALLAAPGQVTGGTVGREEYLDRIDGLVYGENPREGFFREGTVLHPDLGFPITFPTGWRGINERTVVAALAPREDGVVTLSIEPAGAEPLGALRSFLAQEGVSAGRVREETTDGVVRARATFGATTPDGEVLGEVAFATLGGSLYRVTGYASTGRWDAHADAVSRALTSLRPLTDPAALAVQPQRLEIVTLPEAMSIRDFAARYPGPVPVEELARLNRRGPDEIVPAGLRLKRIVGQSYR